MTINGLVIDIPLVFDEVGEEHVPIPKLSDHRAIFVEPIDARGPRLLLTTIAMGPTWNGKDSFMSFTRELPGDSLVLAVVHSSFWPRYQAFR